MKKVIKLYSSKSIRSFNLVFWLIIYVLLVTTAIIVFAIPSSRYAIDTNAHTFSYGFWTQHAIEYEENNFSTYSELNATGISLTIIDIIAMILFLVNIVLNFKFTKFKNISIIEFYSCAMLIVSLIFVLAFGLTCSHWDNLFLLKNIAQLPLIEIVFDYNSLGLFMIICGSLLISSPGILFVIQYIVWKTKDLKNNRI